jgi:hypothetical protein
MLPDRDKWKSLVEIHYMTKALLLKAEEIDHDHEFYYPPLVQQRDTLEHIMRAAFALFYPEDFKKTVVGEGQDVSRYATRQMDKAIGHAYRALFDAADWLSIIFREQIHQTLAGYSRQAINTALPDFTPEAQPKIDAICLQIAELRNKKDIGSDDTVISGAEKYTKLVETLEQYWAKVRAAVPLLDLADGFSSSPNSGS